MAERIRQEFEKIREARNPGITVNVENNNIFIWKLSIIGPDDSPYQGGKFKIMVEFSEFYPNQAPAFYFETPIYHVNIASNGAVCHTVLDKYYTPNFEVYQIILYILSMLINPEPSSYMADRVELADLYNRDKQKYLDNARNFTSQHALSS